MNVDRSAAIQDEFFLRAKRDGGIVTIFLTSGKKLTGHIKGFDRFTLILESHRIDQLIFKHAISTVTIGRPGGEHGPGPRDPHESDRAHDTHDMHDTHEGPGAATTGAESAHDSTSGHDASGHDASGPGADDPGATSS